MYTAMARQNNDVDAIFFDLDNTLIPTRKADEAACKQLVNILTTEYSVPVSNASVICKNYLESFRRCPDNPLVDLEVWRQYLWEKALGRNYQHLKVKIYETWLNLRYRYIAPGLEVKNLLKSLRQSYTLALISNGPSGAQWEKVTKLKLQSFFDLILISGDLPFEKPDKRIFLEACANLGRKPERCVIVGDKLETDVAGGVNANLGWTVWVPLGNEKLCQEDPGPDFVIDSVLKLPKILGKMKNFKERVEEFLPDIEDCNSNGSDGS